MMNFECTSTVPLVQLVLGLVPVRYNGALSLYSLNQNVELSQKNSKYRQFPYIYRYTGTWKYQHGTSAVISYDAPYIVPY
jgi:hypothetical protein